MRICVFALGKLGLPLAVQYASKGHQVVGVDLDPEVLDLVRTGMSPFPSEPGLQPLLSRVVSDGRLTTSSNGSIAVAQAEAVVVVVPLLVGADSRPDFGPLDMATRAIAEGLQPGALVSYETTVPIGTTRDRFLPMLEANSGLRVGRDLCLVFSPERVLIGRVFADLRRYPKIVGGIDRASAERGVEFYRQVLDFDHRNDLDQPNGVWNLGSSEAAEMVKLAETVYRDVSIGLANTFAVHADHLGIDIQTVINACNSQPYSHIHRPGIAVGGHCIPVYPYLYLKTDPDSALIRAARQVNDAMPEYAIGLLRKTLGGPLTKVRVAVLGVAYRGGVKESTFSGVFPVVAALEAQGATALVSDPMYSRLEIEEFGFRPYEEGSHVDAAVIQADHPEYRSLTPSDLPGIRVLLDGRGITRASAWVGVRRILIGSAAEP